MSTFKLYTNAALTIQFTGSLTANQNVDGSTGGQDFVLYLGSIAAGKTLKADSNPGVDQIVASVVDASAGTGEPATAIKLATSQAGLAAATPGASLNLGTTVLSGVGNAIQIWTRVTDATLVAGTYTDLSWQLNALREE